MSFTSWLRNLQSFCRLGTTTRKSRRAASCEPSKRLRLHLEVLEDRITPSFSPAVSYAVVTNPQAMVAADFNNDGHIDLAAANPVPGTVSVLLGDGAGGFGAAIESDVGAVFYHSDGHLGAWISLPVADFDNDGHLDLAMARYFQNYETGDFYGAVGVNMGNGDGTFRAATHPFNNGSVPLSVVAGDFNNDGNSDLAVSSYGVSIFGEYYGQREVLLGNGQGGFTGTGVGYGYGDALLSPSVGDLNRDGNLDVVLVVGAGGQGGDVLLGTPAGGLYLRFSYYNTNQNARAVAIGDFTGDGIPDLVVAGDAWYPDEPNGVDIVTGRGDGTFDEPIAHSANGYYHTGVAVADFNGDGKLDAVTSDADTGTISLLLGNGAGALWYAGAFAVGSLPTAVAVGDFNGDGRPDVAATNGGSNTVSVLLNAADDNPPWLRIHDVTVTEGNTGAALADFVVTLSAASAETVTVAYAIADSTATAGSDYQAASGTLTFAPGETSKTVSVLVNGDRDDDEYSNESFFVNLSGATNASIVDGQAVGTIVDDEPRITTNYSTSRSEGNTGQTPFDFAVNLSSAYDAPVTVNWTTADGSATAGSDYQAASGTLTFAPGEISKPITILVNGDRLPEPNETFYVNLSGATSAVIIYGFSAGTIVDDDPRISAGGTVVEGNSGTKNVTFTVTLPAVYDVPVTVTYATQDGSATSASGDYQAKTGTLTFNPGGPLKQYITVLVNGDRLPEATETFSVNLGGGGQSIATILDNEPRISISDVTRTEGRSGKTLFTFTVTLSAAYDQAVTMSFRTVNGTATTGDSDYIAKTGTLTFNPGQTTKTITIEVKGDSKREANETFNLDLFYSSSNSLFTKNRGLGTIQNDD